MSSKESPTKKIAAAACVLGLLLFGAACSSTISGSATYSGEGTQETSKAGTSGEKATTSEGDETTSTDEGELSTSAGGGSITTDQDNPAAKAPQEPYTYDNGVTVQLSAPVADDGLDGMLPDEVGRVVTMTFTNPSEATFDFSNLAYYSAITCPASSPNTDQYILNYFELNEISPAVGAGKTATFTYEIAVREAAVESDCLFEIELQSESFDSIETVAFVIVFPAG